MEIMGVCASETASIMASEFGVVVEGVSDLWALERAGALSAKYHVLGGVLSQLDGIGPSDLTIDALVDRKSTRLNSSHNSESRMPSSA
jgi:recombinational DNA repair protein RecR